MFKAAEINLKAFDEPLTPEAAYWIGFLRADGCISQRINSAGKPYPLIILSLDVREEEQISKFLKFLGSSSRPSFSKQHQTNFGPTKTVSAMVWAQGLEEKLSRYGVVPRKTYIDASAPESLKLNPDFWRGVIDGDGCVTFVKNCNKSYPAIAVGGVRLLIEDAADAFLHFGGFRPKVAPCRSIFKIGVNGSRAQRVVKLLYYPDCTSLNRKQTSAEQILAWKPRYKSRTINKEQEVEKS